MIAKDCFQLTIALFGKEFVVLIVGSLHKYLLFILESNMAETMTITICYCSFKRYDFCVYLSCSVQGQKRRSTNITLTYECGHAIATHLHG